MNFTEALSAFRKHQQLMAAYGHVMGVTYLDASTAAPKGSYAGRGQAMGILTQITYDLSADPKNTEILDILEANATELDSQTRREVEVARKGYDQIRRIPAEEYVAYSVMLNEAEAVWETAKNTNDFGLFAPFLQQIVDYNRKFAGYYDAAKAPYDALLNEFEEGLNMATLDAFFATLRSVIVPLVEEISKKPAVDDSFLFQSYPVEQQKKFSAYLMEVWDWTGTTAALPSRSILLPPISITRMCASPPIIMKTRLLSLCTP